jgi:murein DD-endopeptidase MepM/ murein hydrolase activator NlpD
LLWLAWLATPSADVFAAPLTQEQEPVEHVVQAGETLFAIAQQYNTTVEALVEANDIADPSLIAAGQTLIVPARAGEGSAQEGSQGGEQHRPLNTYVIVPGDTLEAVARRFDTSAATLAELNGVLSPTGLPAGGRLQVPGENVGRLHRVAQDETALGLALRYDLPLWEFLAINGLGSPGALLPGQRVWAPGEVLTDGLPLPLEVLDVGPVPILQGRTVRVRVDLVSEGEVRGVFDNRTLNFAVEGNAHYALFGLHAQDDEPGNYILALLVTDASGDEVYLTRPLQVLDGGYQTEELNLTVDLLDTAAIVAERERVAEIRPVFTSERYWEGLFTLPITTEVTSAFGTRRLYKYPSTQFYGYHEGTDFDGQVGSLVYAPAAGVVVLAEELYLRGNALVIDHGWGVYTGYWHLSQFDVRAGQRVEAGQLIARVGSTGRSTGAHLHWDLWVNGTNVSALQWTEQLFP